jgi:F-box protein 9
MMEDTDELAEFRKQWQDELLQWKGARKSLSNVELATELFLKGVASERRGTHYEALHYYRQAIQLVPDIESQLSEEQHILPLLPEDYSSEEVVDEEGLLPVNQKQAIGSQRYEYLSQALVQEA